MKNSLVAAMLGAVVVLGVASAQAIEPMSPQQIIELGKPAVGYSYYWGHGRFRTDGATPGSCSGSCPSCTHSGQYGGDCSGFIAKAWQVPGPIALDKDAHPYSTYNFDNESTHWKTVDKGTATKADAFVYNVNGAGHIFLHEGGDPWGYVNAYECKGCSYGCTYGSRKAESKYKVIRRNSLTGDCQAHCEGSKIVGDDCGQGDCAAYGATCVDDALGVRCVFSACPATGEATVCLDDKTLGTCQDGQITQGDCSAFAALCSTAGGLPAHCASVFCVGSPKDVPQAHDLCFLDGQRRHCDEQGNLQESPCQAGSQCVTYPDVHCQAGVGCPATGSGTHVCLDDRVMAECHEGAATNATNCAEIDAYCSTALGGEPRCLPAACVAGPDDKPSEHVACTADGQVAHCHADGSSEITPCSEGTSCHDGACHPDAAGTGGSSSSGGAPSEGKAGGSPTAGKTGSGGSKNGSGAGNGDPQAGSGAQGGKGGKTPLVVSLAEESESGGCHATPRPASRWGAAALLSLAACLVRRRRRGVPPPASSLLCDVDAHVPR